MAKKQSLVGDLAETAEKTQAGREAVLFASANSYYTNTFLPEYRTALRQCKTVWRSAEFWPDMRDYVGIVVRVLAENGFEATVELENCYSDGNSEPERRYKAYIITVKIF